MAMVDYTFYQNTYMGDTIASTDWSKYEARAEDIVCAMTRWKVTANTIADFPALTVTLFKKAICAQADALMLNGMESITGGVSEGFTVGKVTVQAKAGGTYKAGALANAIAPLALAYLEQTSLMNPVVSVAPDMPLVGWW